MAVADERRWVDPRSVGDAPTLTTIVAANGEERAVVDDVPSAFEVVDYDSGDAPGLTVRGELDIAAVRQVELALDTAIRESAGAFVLDLSGLEFLDSSGLRVVLRARASLARDERHLAIVCPPGPVRRLLEVAGVADLFFLYDTRSDVAAALVPSD